MAKIINREMKKLIFLLISCVVCISVHSQTKLIAFKSHSGNMINYSLALSNKHFDLEIHNLGMAPEPTIQQAEIDSVIFISDSVAVMVTSTVCKNSPWFYGNDSTVDFESKTLWSAGRDTVVNHPLFSQQHSLDSIKSELKRNYYFQNDIEKTVFVGFDNGDDEPEGRENESAPVIDNDPPQTPGPGMMILFLGLFAVFAGLISWRFAMIKRENAIKTA